MRPDRGGTPSEFFTLFRAELVHFTRDPVLFRLAVLLPLSILIAVWEYSGSSLVPAIASALVLLEPRFNNFLFTSPAEGEALSLFPSRWRAIIAAKNLSTTLLFILLVLLLAVPIGFFGTPVSGREWSGGMLYTLTVLFPLLSLGNLQSLQHPRRSIGWSLGDLADAILLLLTAGIASIPYAVIAMLDLPPLWCLLYAAAGAWIWWRFSLARSERLLREGTVLERVEA